MVGLRFLLEEPQLYPTHKKYPLPLNPCEDNWCQDCGLQCVQVKSQPRCRACENVNAPRQFRDEERCFAEPSRTITWASAGPDPAPKKAPSRGPSSQIIVHPEVSPARSDSVGASGLYWGTQAPLGHGDQSPYASRLPLYGLFSSPQSNPEPWFSPPLMGPAGPHYESNGQHSYTSSLPQPSNDTLCGSYTSYNIADTQWDRVLNHTSLPSTSGQVNMPNLAIPVHLPLHRQNEPQSPNYLASDPELSFLDGSSSALELASSSVQRATPNCNVDPDVSVFQPIVDAVLNVREDRWPPTEQLYFTANTLPPTGTHDRSTHFPRGPAQYDSDSMVITRETAAVPPYQRSPSPGPHLASHLSLPPSSPEILADVFTVSSQQRRDVAIAETETSSDAPSSVETDPAPTSTQRDRITDMNMTEEPHFCRICCVSFTLPQSYRRHLKDKHEEKESCKHCSSFKWSRGRPHLYRKHLRLKHPKVTSSEGRHRKDRKSRAVGAGQRKIPNKDNQSNSGNVFPRPDCRCHGVFSVGITL